MHKKIIIFLLVFSFYFVFAEADDSPKQDNIGNLPVFSKYERILILAPHPDDETIGCAGVIQEALRNQAEVKIVYLTNGDNNEFSFIVYEKRLTIRKSEFVHMGQVRRKEAIRAMRSLGVSADDLIFLGYPDFGTFAMFTRYWNSKLPFKSMFTRVTSVPYKNNFSYGKEYRPQNVVEDLKRIITVYKPDKIFVSHPADVNVDHKSLYLFLQIALADLTGKIKVPLVYPYLVHSLAWPLPRHYHPELDLLPPQNFSGSQIRWQKLDLSKEQLDKKYKAILCYKSQTMVSAFYLLSFARKNELFGDYPKIRAYPQSSPSERGVQFFGFTSMYLSSQEEPIAGSKYVIDDAKNVSYAVVDNKFLIHIKKTAEISLKSTFQFYIFGYNYTKPFTQMPKIFILARGKNLKVFDGNKLINHQGVNVRVNRQEFSIEVPLELIGRPDFILVSAKAYKIGLPVDSVGFRKIEIVKGG